MMIFTYDITFVSEWERTEDMNYITCTCKGNKHPDKGN